MPFGPSAGDYVFDHTPAGTRSHESVQREILFQPCCGPDWWDREIQEPGKAVLCLGVAVEDPCS